MRMQLGTGLLVCVLLLAAPSGASGDGPPRLAVGAPFPSLALPAADDGRPVSIAAYRGRRVVLHVFASW